MFSALFTLTLVTASIPHLPQDMISTGKDHVWSKLLAESLWKTLFVSGKFCNAFSGYVPGANIIGGAMTYGADLLNPEATIQDLHTEMNKISQRLQNIPHSEYITNILNIFAEEIQEKLEDEFKENKHHMCEMLKEVPEQQENLTKDIQVIKNMVEETFMLVNNLKYKVWFIFLCILLPVSPISFLGGFRKN